MYSKKLRDVLTKTARLANLFDLDDIRLGCLQQLGEEAQDILDDALYNDVINAFEPVLETQFCGSELNRAMLKDCTRESLITYLVENHYYDTVHFVCTHLEQVDEIIGAVQNYIEVIEDRIEEEACKEAEEEKNELAYANQDEEDDLAGTEPIELDMDINKIIEAELDEAIEEVNKTVKRHSAVPIGK